MSVHNKHWGRGSVSRGELGSVRKPEVKVIDSVTVFMSSNHYEVKWIGKGLVTLRVTGLYLTIEVKYNLFHKKVVSFLKITVIYFIDVDMG